MNPLQEQLQKVIARMNRVHLYKSILLGLSVGLFIALVVLIYGRFNPIQYAITIALAAIVIGVTVGGFISRLKRKQQLDAARKVDREYANDAIVAALQLDAGASEHASLFAGIQREHATTLLEEYNKSLNKRIPILQNKQIKIQTISAMIGLLMVVTLMVIPNKQAVLAKTMASEQQAIVDASNKIESLIKKLDDMDIEHEEKQQIKQALQKMYSELLSNRQLTESSIQQLEKELQAIAKHERRSETFEPLREAMKHPLLEKLAPLLNKDQADQNYAEAKKLLEEMSDTDRASLSEQLSQLAKQGESEVSELLQRLSEELGKSQLQEEGLKEALQQLQDTLKQSQQTEKASNAAKEMNEELQNSLSELAEKSTTNPNAQGLQQMIDRQRKRSNQNPSSQQGNDTGKDDDTSENTNSSNGDDTSSSEGKKESESNGGKNASNNGGSTNPSGGNTPSNNQAGEQSNGGPPSGQGAGIGSTNQQMITTPRKYQGTGEPTLDDTKTEGGKELTGGEAQIREGELKHYSEALGQYEADAKESLSRSTLPLSVQDKVKAYFESIQIK